MNLILSTSKDTTTTQVYLVWTAPTSSVQDTYRVTVSRTDNTALSANVKIEISGNTVKVSVLLPGVQYKFVVQSVSNGRRSVNSNEIKERTCKYIIYFIISGS